MDVLAVYHKEMKWAAWSNVKGFMGLLAYPVLPLPLLYRQPRGSGRYLPTNLHYRYQTGKFRVTQKGCFCSRKHQPHPLLVVFKGEGALTEGSDRVCREEINLLLVEHVLLASYTHILGKMAQSST